MVVLPDGKTTIIRWEDGVYTGDKRVLSAILATELGTGVGPHPQVHTTATAVKNAHTFRDVLVLLFPGTRCDVVYHPKYDPKVVY